ncbi:hypothetical protein BH11MYX4_BH11MYX4_23050 [soil metagenome]
MGGMSQLRSYRLAAVTVASGAAVTSLSMRTFADTPMGAPPPEAKAVVEGPKKGADESQGAPEGPAPLPLPANATDPKPGQ